MKSTILSYIAIILLATSCNSEKPTYIEPHLTTLTATNITRTEAVLNGTASIEGDADMPQLYFKYGTTSDMPQTTDPVNAKSTEVSFSLEHLTAGTTYYYMLQGNNGRTTIHSNTMTFTTLPNEKPSMGNTQILSHGPTSVIIGVRRMVELRSSKQDVITINPPSNKKYSLATLEVLDNKNSS